MKYNNINLYFGRSSKNAIHKQTKTQILRQRQTSIQETAKDISKPIVAENAID